MVADEVVELVGNDDVTSVWVQLSAVRAVRRIDGQWSVAYAWGSHSEPRLCQVTEECGESTLALWQKLVKPPTRRRR